MRLAQPPSEPRAVAVVSVETAANLAGSRAVETRRAYRRMVARWAAWATSRGAWPKTWEPPPSDGWRAATAGDMADWLSFLASEGLGISAVRIARAAVSAAHREGASLQVLAGGEGLADPAQDWLVSATIGGIARRSDPPSQAPGLRVHGFARILAVVELEATPATPRGRRAIRDAALLWIMRDGLLRRGEAAALQWDDLAVEEDGSGRLTVRRSKTDQTGEGAVLWISPPATEALQRWREIAARPSMFDLTGRSVGRVVTRRAEAVGLSASGHSLRVGMAQDLAAAGANFPELCQAGRWQSPTTAIRYIRSQTAGRGAVARYYRRP